MADETGWIAVKDLKPHPDNPRDHTDEQIQKIARSIDKLDWGRPIIISQDNYILAGHGAYLAATDELNLMSVPYKRMEHLHDSPEAIAYMLADNKLTDESDWNYGKLESNFQNIKLKGFDVELTGFEDVELKEVETKIEEKQFLNGEQTPYKRDEFSSLVDEFKDEKGKCKKDENWFYIEFYGDDEKFKELFELLKDKIVGQGKHELNSEWFYNLVKG